MSISLVAASALNACQSLSVKGVLMPENNITMRAGRKLPEYNPSLLFRFSITFKFNL